MVKNDSDKNINGKYYKAENLYRYVDSTHVKINNFI